MPVTLQNRVTSKQNAARITALPSMRTYSRCAYMHPASEPSYSGAEIILFFFPLTSALFLFMIFHRRKSTLVAAHISHPYILPRLAPFFPRIHAAAA